jgi:hypothetical protein
MLYVPAVGKAEDELVKDPEKVAVGLESDPAAP